MGIPNAGKTTYSQRYDNVIHLDEEKGGRHRWGNIVEAVRKDNTICVEGVYERADMRIPLVNACKGKKTCIWLNTPLDECIDREIHGRNRSVKMVEWAAEDLEPPTYDEGWDEIIVIGDGSNEDNERMVESCGNQSD